MIKNISKILLGLFLSIVIMPASLGVYANVEDVIKDIIVKDVIKDVDNINSAKASSGSSKNNNYLDKIDSDNMINSRFFIIGTEGEQGLQNLILNIARDLRVVIFALVLVIGIIIVIRLLFGENSEEEAKKLKMGILWMSIGIIVMQIAYTTYKVLFDYNIDLYLGRSFSEELVEPFTNMLMLFASFIFIAMGIYAFFKIITANGEEDQVSKGKTTIIHAIIGFIVIKISSTIVKNTFNPDCRSGNNITMAGTKVCGDATKNVQIITALINWFNTFVAIIIVIMTIYAGFLILTSSGDQEKIDKAKRILLYIGVGLLILFGSYLILTFFLKPEALI